MDINVDTPIYEEINHRKFREKLRDTFNKKDKDVKLNTPIPISDKIKRRRKRER